MGIIKNMSKAIAAAIAGFLVTIFAQQGIDLSEPALVEVLTPIAGALVAYIIVWVSPANKKKTS